MQAVQISQNVEKEKEATGTCFDLAKKYMLCPKNLFPAYQSQFFVGDACILSSHLEVRIQKPCRSWGGGGCERTTNAYLLKLCALEKKESPAVLISHPKDPLTNSCGGLPS